MSNIDIGDLNLSDLDFSDFDFTDTNTDMDDYNEYLGSMGSSFPSFATLAYYQALSRDEMQYGAEAEYRQQFYNFIDQLSNQIYNAIANGQSTISRGDKYQPYPDDPTLAASVDGFFNAIFGSDGEADVYEVANSDLFAEAISEYNTAPYYFDFATGWSTIDSPSTLVESAETANQERLDDIAAQEEADRIAEEERIAQEEAAARQAALDNADSIFRTAGYNPTATEVATFADNPDGIADYIDPRQVTAEEARQVLNDAGIPDSVLDGEFAERWVTVINGATGQGNENFQSTVNTNLGDYADKRIVTEAEARGYFEDLGYEPSPEEIADFVGVIDDPMRTDNYDTRNNVGDYVDPRQITEAEARGYFEDLGYEPSPEEIQDFMGQGGADFESTRSGELGTYVDEHQVTRAELEQIAAEQGYELDSDDDYGQYIRQGADIDQADIKATAERDFDEGATSVEEVQEIYRRRAGVDISNAEAQALLDLAILEGDGSPNLSEEGFGGWATENIEVDLRQHLENLGNGVLNILFGSTDVEEILQQQMETLLPPSPSEENYEEKYNEWLKRQSGSIISINNSPATSGTWAGVRFPVPIPASGPEVVIPIFDAEGNYQGPSSVGELLIGENGVITQVKEGIETQIGEIKETGIEIFGEDGQGGVLGQVIDLGQATIDTVTGQATYTPEDPGIIFNEETGEVYETGAETGMPVAEDPDRDRDSYPNEEDAFPDDPNEWLDTDEDGVGDNADVFPEDPNETLDTDADGVGDNADVFPEDPNETLDTDADGVGDNADVFPEDPNETLDTDADGVGDNADVFPEDPNETVDTDADGVGDNSDLFPEDASETADADGDGVGDNSDLFPEDASETADADGDGVGDNSDLFPEDASESVDTDGDGVGDSSDAFPEDANESVDTDGDGIGDNQDDFPEDANNGVDPDATEDGTIEDGTTDEGTTDEGTTDDGLDEGTTDEGTTDDGATDEGTTDEGTTDEGTTDEGTTDEGTTDEGTTDTDEGPEFPDDYATQQNVFDAKQEVLAEIGNPEDGTGLWGELNALGLENDEITALLGNPSGVDEDGNPIEAQGLYALVEGAATSDELTAAITQIEGFIGQPQYADDGTTIIGGTGLYGLYDETRDIKDILGEPERDDAGNLIGGTGLFGDLYGQQTQISDVADLVGQPAYDEDGNLTADSTGLYLEFYDAGLSDTEIKNLIGTPDNPETDENEASGLYLAYQQGTESTQNYIDDVVNPQLVSISDRVGTPAVEDDPTTEEDESEDATGLYLAVEEGDQAVIDYIGAPEIDPETGEIVGGTGLYADLYALGLDTDRIIELIGDPESETGLYGLIGSPAIPDDPNTPEDESRPGTGVYGQIDAFAGDISDQIDTSQEETNQYLDYISGVIGRPASDLTQDDVDMVIDLLAEDEFISDFNNDMRLYDVNFDGQIDQSDIGLLQGFVDAGVEGIGEIPATGIYADAARRQEEITGSIADQAGETRELIGDEAAETRRIVGQQNLFNALLGSGDLMGRQVDVTTPDPVQLKYVYDFSDIFATPQQRGLFPSPYGAPQRQAAQQVAQQRGIMSGPLNLGGLQRPPGMAAGGKVDYDFTDEIMHIMSYGDS